MNGQAIPGAYLFRLYVCDKEMSQCQQVTLKKCCTTGKSLSLATKWHPNKAEMNRLCALVEDKCLNHFQNILKKREVQSTLNRF
jgi:hypothetical protein